MMRMRLVGAHFVPSCVSGVCVCVCVFHFHVSNGGGARVCACSHWPEDELWPPASHVRMHGYAHITYVHVRNHGHAHIAHV